MNDPKAISVLLVEDDPLQRAMAGQILSMDGRLAVTVAGDGLEGLELALTCRPQVILLDLILPGISGLELLRRYRAQGGKAKVLALSQAPGQWVCDAALTAGADFFFPKPVRWDEILRLLFFLCDETILRCRSLLAALGAPAAWAGFSQAAVAAGFLARRRDVQMKEVYIEAARRTGGSPSGVEINIRRLVRFLYEGGKPSAPWLPAGEGVPSNKDFLQALARAVTIPL